jgi:NAD dependent epimerase/dehydratase family enzyme
MTEEQKPSGDTPAEGQKASGELLAEFQMLGQQLATAVKSLWESEDSRRLRQQLSEGFAQLGQTIDSTIKSAQESEAAKQFSEQVKETVDKARTSDVTDKVEQGILTGLRELNEQISKLVGSMEKKQATTTEPEDQAKA